MQIQVDTSNPNLVIVDATNKTDDAANAEIRAITVDTVDAHLSVIMASSNTILVPATHDWNVATQTGLKFLKNPVIVDRETGYAKSGSVEPLDFAPVKVYENDDTKRYYFDYKVKLASTEADMPYSALKITLDSPDISGNAANEYQHAASVDFYLESVSSANYLGTANLKNPPTELTLNRNGTPVSGSIPLNTSEGACCINIIMRFYFDGALEKSAGQAYVHSKNLTPTNFHMSISFEAVEPAS